MTNNYLYCAHHIENNNFYEDIFDTKIESRVSNILNNFMDYTNPKLNEDNFEAWALFLLAQRARVPSRISQVKEFTKELFEKNMGVPDPHFDEVKPYARHETLADYIKEFHPQIPANYHLDGIMSSIFSIDNVNKILAMRWMVIRNLPSQIPISDDPIMLTGALGDKDCVLCLPISPTTLFAASANSELLREIANVPRRRLCRCIRESQVRQAHRIVVGENLSRSFLRHRLRRRILDPA